MAAQLRELADHEVLRVVPRDCDECVGAVAASLHLGPALVGWRVHHDRAELLLDEIGAAPIGFDDSDLMPGLEERLRKMESDLPRPSDDEVHVYRVFTGSWTMSASCASAFRMRTSPTSRSS